VFTVSGTFGQHDAGGPLAGGGFSVAGGFWSPLSLDYFNPSGLAPAVLTQLQSQFVYNTNLVSLSVAVSGTPTLFFQWQKNGVNLADNPNITGTSTSNLTVSTAPADFEGDYTVVIVNACGSMMSSVATLTRLGGNDSTFNPGVGANGPVVSVVAQPDG
jgi:hypothetical protein